MTLQKHHRDHQHRLVTSHHVHIHGTGGVGRFNTRAALVVSNVLSSMWFFWFCALLDLVELPQVVAARSVVLWVAYISQTVIQLLALPALGANAKLLSAVQDEQSRAQAETLTAMLEINRHQVEILERLDRTTGHDLRL